MAEDTQGGQRSNVSLDFQMEGIKALTDVAKEWARTFHGVFLGFGGLGVLMLFFGLFYGKTPAEHYAYMGLGGVVTLAALILYFLSMPIFERMQATARQVQDRADEETASVRAILPVQLDEPAASEAAVKLDPELQMAPDGTFVFRVPSHDWKVDHMELLDAAADELDGKMPFDRAAASARLQYHPGKAVLIRRRPQTLSFSTENSLMNGRPAVLTDEQVRPTVVIFSVSKRGLTIAELTGEHVFAMMLSGSIQLGGKAVEINRLPFPESDRTAIFGRFVKAFDNVLVDGEGPYSFTSQMEVHVVERSHFIYVIQASWLDGIPNAKDVETDVRAIVASVRTVKAVAADTRAREDAAYMDQSFEAFANANTQSIIALRISALIDAMRTPGGTPQVSAEHVAAARTLLGYARSPRFRDRLSPAMTEDVDMFADATEAAYKGTPAPLQTYIARFDAAREAAATAAAAA